MASWLSSRLKAAEQFLNQIDATAADRALKKKERAQAGLDSDSELGEPGIGRHFSRTASELSFTDEFTPSSRQSEDETFEGPPRFTRHSSLPRPKERQPQKKEAPPAADWTKLLKGAEKSGAGNGLKLVRTGSSVNTAPARAPRIPKHGGATPPGALPTGAVPVTEITDKRQPPSMLMSAESTGSATTAPDKSSEPEVVSKREGGPVPSNGEEPSTTAPEREIAQTASVNRPSKRGAEGANGLRRDGNGSSVRRGETLIDPDVGTSGRSEPERGTSETDGENVFEADPVRDSIQSNSGPEAVIPTSNSEEKSAIVRTINNTDNEKEPLVDEKTAQRKEAVFEAGETASQSTSNLAKSDEAAVGFEERANSDQLNVGSGYESTEVGKAPTSCEADPSSAQQTTSGPTVESRHQGQAQTEVSREKSPDKDVSRTGVDAGRRNFSMRDYMGQDLAVKEVDTERSDVDSGSGTDEETDSDSDDSEDERAAEEQRQKEEAERQALERQRAAAAAAALEATAAETATQAVKEREDVVALLEKEREELQVEAAEASEQHAREIARLRATASAGSEAAHVEKSSHSSTRMETYSKEEILVMENVEKAKALAAAQRSLEGVVATTLEARRKVEERELYRAGLRKQLSDAQHQLRVLREGSEAEAATSSHAESSLHAELDRWEDDVRRKEQRVAELEARLTAAKGQKREPSDHERELERRLQSLTDHLIQKQAQVEALASEKATLALRLETVSVSLHDEEQGDGPFRKRGKGGRTGPNGTEWWMDDDLEYGLDESRRGRRSSFDPNDSDDDGKKHKAGIVPGFLLTALQRFDGLALGGGRFLRVHTPARVLLGLYLLLVHAWVLLVWSIQSSGALEESVSGELSGLPGVSQAVRAVATRRHFH